MAIDLGKKVGPLPLGGWVVVVGGGLVVGYFINRNASKGSDDPAIDPNSDVGTGGGSFLPINPPSEEPEEAEPETNVSWGNKAIRWLTAQNIDPLVATSAVNKFLNGQTLSPQESAAIAMVLGKYGPPPEGVAAPPDDPRPKAPSGFVATFVGPNDITFTWLPVLGATSYEVSSRDNTGRASGPFTTQIPSWHGGNGVPGRTYTFYVRAVNEFGKSEPGIFTQKTSSGGGTVPKPPVKPSPKPPTKPAPKPPTQRRYTIQKGDTLWSISAKFYGTGTRWLQIYNRNAGAIEASARAHGKASSRGPNGQMGWFIYPGATIWIP